MAEAGGRLSPLRVCVYCGSNTGSEPAFAAAARHLGTLLATRGLGLVYGGGHVGLMGILADAALGAGGEVIGVIPESLHAREVAHRGLTTLHIVATMHERKALMAELSGSFVALPGGLGTLDELFEIWTWAQLGMHAKPCGLLEVEGFFAPLIAYLDHATEAKFIRTEHRAMLTVDTDPERLLDRMAAYAPPTASKWLA